jgi:hypothetical protein
VTEADALVLSSFAENKAAPTTINGEGFALTTDWNGLAPLVFATMVLPGPAPRSVMPLLTRR